MTGEYISQKMKYTFFLVILKKYLNFLTQHTRVYFERPVTYTLPSGISGFTLKGQ
jgi:hypothetical protein